MIKTAQQSLLDLLFKVMPDLKNQDKPVLFLIQQKPGINDKAVQSLMSLWENEKNAVNYRQFKRPADITREELDLMLSENLIRESGDIIELTAKGLEVIKTSILGDERSSFEHDGKPLKYEKALANTKPQRTIKGAKKASQNAIGGNWYKQLKNKWD